MRRLVIGALALALGVSAVGVARARGTTPGAHPATTTPVPAACADGGQKQRAHATGRRQGGAMVDSAWAAVHQACAELPRVEQEVREAIAQHQPPANASDVIKCRSTGFEIGAEDELSRLGATCNGN
jgi:hypothetical protein